MVAGRGSVIVGAKADYTLAQAIALVNLLATMWHQHWLSCEQCVCTDLYGKPGYCERGQQLQDNRAKWKRRVKYAARREGVQITV